MNHIAISLLLTLSVFLVGLALTLMPFYTSRLTPLGVRIPASQAGNEAVTATVRSYVRTGTVSTGIASVISLVCAIFLDADAMAWAVVIIIVALLAIGIANFAVHHNRLVSLKNDAGWFRSEPTEISGSVTVASARTAIDNIASTRWVGPLFVASFLVILLGTAWIALHWESIPERFATHWNAAGEVDAWATKSVLTVFALPLITLVIVTLIFVVCLPIRHGSVGVRSAGSEVEKIKTQARNQASLPWIAGLTLFLSIGMMALAIATVTPSLADSISAIGAILAVGTLTIAILMIVAITRVNAKVDRLIEAGEISASSVSSPDNDAHYIGGLIYHNPDDPAIFVDRRAGVGLSLNFAHWQARAIAVAIVVVPLAIVAVTVVAA